MNNSKSLNYRILLGLLKQREYAIISDHKERLAELNAAIGEHEKMMLLEEKEKLNVNKTLSD